MHTPGITILNVIAKSKWVIVYTLSSMRKEDKYCCSWEQRHKIIIRTGQNLVDNSLLHSQLIVAVEICPPVMGKQCCMAFWDTLFRHSCLHWLHYCTCLPASPHVGLSLVYLMSLVDIDHLGAPHFSLLTDSWDGWTGRGRGKQMLELPHWEQIAHTNPAHNPTHRKSHKLSQVANIQDRQIQPQVQPYIHTYWATMILQTNFLWGCTEQSCLWVSAIVSEFS